MPSRVIREGLLDSDLIGRVAIEAEAMFVRVMLLADDFGRYDGRLPVICRRAFVNRREITEQECGLWLDQLVREGLIELYEVDGKPYLEIRNFRQRTRAQRSKYPEPRCTADQLVSSQSVGQMPDKCPAVVGRARTESESGSETKSEEKRCASGEADPCPHEEIIRLYHEILPISRRIRAWTARRRAHLRARWREAPERQNLDWWRQFFENVRASDFLMGRAHRKDRPPFCSSLDWLVKEENFIKVLEGAYANRKQPADQVCYAINTH